MSDPFKPMTKAELRDRFNDLLERVKDDATPETVAVLMTAFEKLAQNNGPGMVLLDPRSAHIVFHALRALSGLYVMTYMETDK